MVTRASTQGYKEARSKKEVGEWPRGVWNGWGSEGVDGGERKEELTREMEVAREPQMEK